MAFHECKAQDSAFLLDNTSATTIIRAILFLYDPFQFIFLHKTPDASRVLLFVATLGDFAYGFNNLYHHTVINNPTQQEQEK